MPCDLQATNLQVAGRNSICHLTNFSQMTSSVPADLSSTKFYFIDTSFHQSLSTFNTFVRGVTGVCLDN